MAVALWLPMRIALSHWQGRIAPVFDVAENLLVVDTTGRNKQMPRKVRLLRKHEWGRASELRDMQVELLVCGAVSRAMEKALIENGVRVNGFICGNLEEVMAAALKGALNDPRFRMPGAGKSSRKRDVLPEDRNRNVSPGD